MFEEDFERCFICQQPSKGLYCSAECRQLDKGSASPAVKAMTTPTTTAPVRLTAQLPVSLSPMVRPTHTITPSPNFGARKRGNSSSSSSLSDSPIQSPQTNASATDSPRKESFHLPPPAFPTMVSFGSVPVKIPSNVASRVPSTATSIHATPGSHATAYPSGASVDTLRFGRKSSVTNVVTSPLATARCGCGRAFGHMRNRSRDRLDLTETISCLNLGPKLTTTDDIGTGTTSITSGFRMVSDPGFRLPIVPKANKTSSPAFGPASLLSRSRSDPADTLSPRNQRGIHPRPAPAVTGTTDLSSPPPSALPPVVKTKSTGANTLPAPADERRGRSRERMPVRGDTTPDRPTAKLQYHEEREVAPTRTSRSRGRNHSRDRSERLRSRSRSRSGDMGLALNLGLDDRGRAPRQQRVLA